MVRSVVDSPHNADYPRRLGKFGIGADVAQLVEQLICNQQVGGSSPFVSSIRLDSLERMPFLINIHPDFVRGGLLTGTVLGTVGCPSG